MRFLDEDVPPRDGNPAYPWPRAAEDGRPVVLEYGQDWDDDSSADKVIASARAWGYRRKYRLRTRRLSDERVVVQFVRPGGSELY